jgi:hypothetical protein
MIITQQIFLCIQLSTGIESESEYYYNTECLTNTRISKSAALETGYGMGAPLK